MVKRTGPTNAILKSLIEGFKRNSSERTPLWEDVAKKLAKPTRSKVEVNLSKINRNSKEGETVLVPGVVLSSGILKKKVNIAAWKFSAAAEKKIEEAGSKMMTLEELKKENPKGTNVKLMV